MSSRFSRDFATVLANKVLPEPWGKYLNVKCIDNSLVRLVTFFCGQINNMEVDMKESLHVM